MARRCGSRVGGPTPLCDAGRVRLSASPTRVLMPPVLVPPDSSGKGTGGIDARRLYANEFEEPGVSARVKRRAHARSASSPWRSSASSVSAAVEPEAAARTGLAPQFGSDIALPRSVRRPSHTRAPSGLLSAMRRAVHGSANAADVIRRCGAISYDPNDILRH